MPDIRHYIDVVEAALTEKVHNFKVRTSTFVRLLIDPSPAQIAAECDRCLIPLYRYRSNLDSVDLRGIIEGTDHLYLWSGYDAIHHDVIREMGLDPWTITTFETGFGPTTVFFRQGGGGFGGQILQNAGPVEASRFHRTLVRGLEQARLKMVAYRETVDPDTLN